MTWGKRGTGRARQLRRDQTPAEKLLWPWLRANRMLGFKFRRQHPVGPFFLDFACVDLAFGIELDGGIHETQVAYDASRDEFLHDRDWEILRIKNEDVVSQLHAVLEMIAQEIRKVSPLPDPLPLGERETDD